MSRFVGIVWRFACACAIIHLYYVFQVTSSEDEEVEMGSGRMFDTIAAHYDSINKMMSLGLDQTWRGKMVAALELQHEDKVLDLATGTADVAILVGQKITELAKKSGNQHCSNDGSCPAGKQQVVGIDPSANMLDNGRKKVTEKELDQVVTLQLGDAQDLKGLKSSSFDKVTMSFGIRNVPDQDAALSEIYRVVKKSENSRVVIMEFHNPQKGVMAPMSRFFIQYITPVLGYFFSGSLDEYSHLQKSIMEFPDPDVWTEKMKAANLDVIKSEDIFFGIVYLHIAVPSAF